MNEPLISFLLIDTAENSPSKFESSQAEISAFFNKLQVPITIHSLQKPQDAGRVISTSRAQIFAIADSPIRFPLTQVLSYLQVYIEDPLGQEDLFFLTFPAQASDINSSFLQNIATSTLSPPHTQMHIESFPPLVIATGGFAQANLEVFSQSPFWLRLALNLHSAKNKKTVRSRQELFTGQKPGTPLGALGTNQSPGPLKTMALWWEFQQLVSRFRR